MFKRQMENKGKMLFGQWSLPEFEYLKNNKWVWTEKVDGTNIRVMFDGNEINYNGKTDNAQLHTDLIKRLQYLFNPQLELFKETFKPKNEQEKTEVCFYGEGYGAGIQTGGNYKKVKDFVLFDIKIGNWWLNRIDIEEIAKKFNIEIVPIIGSGTLEEAIEITKKGFKSQWGDFIAEGIVLRPEVELKTRRGDRIITKIKHKDFN